MNKKSPKTSLFVLLAGNLFILVAAILLKWNVFDIVYIYIIETFIIGFFNVFKMSLAKIQNAEGQKL